MTGCWVFGYGSLVSPVSFGSTLGRELRLGTDFLEAEVDGYCRRWNYGVMHTEGTSIDDDGGTRTWTIVALGVVPVEGARVNGVLAWVDDTELALLDHRERHYDRVDITARVVVRDAPDRPRSPVVTYVPRPEARRHFETARAEGRAAVERRYWDLVDAAFAALGPDRHARYHATTPAPGVPVLELQRHPIA